MRKTIIALVVMMVMNGCSGLPEDGKPVCKVIKWGDRCAYFTDCSTSGTGLVGSCGLYKVGEAIKLCVDTAKTSQVK